MINYKKGFLFLIFLDCALLGLYVTHDIYHVFLAIASSMFAYGIVCLFFRSKILMLIFYILISVAVCQLSVTGKRAFADENFKQEIHQGNPTGLLVGDIAHGFRKIKDCPQAIKQAFIEVRNNNNYSLLENINYRYFTMVILLPFIMISIILRAKPKKVFAKNRT